MEAKKLVTAGRVGANGDDVTTWALPEGAIARLGRGSVRDMAFSPDGQYFAVGTAIGLWLYELPTLSPIALWDTERGMIDTAIFSSDSRRIVTYTFCEELKIWDVQSGTCVTRIAIPNKRHTSRPVFSQDGQRIAVVSYEKNGKIYIWCAHTGTQLSESEIGETYGIYPFQFSPDTRLLAGRKRATDSDPESILVWHVETEEQIGCFTGYPEKMEKLCFSLDGRYLAAGSSDGTIHVWDVESEQLATTYTDYGDAQIFPYYEPEDGLIAAAVSDRKVEVWHIEQNEKLDEFEHRGNSRYACFSENGKQLAVASPSEIKVWAKGDTTSHTLSTLHGHIPTMDTLVFSEDEKTLAAGFWRDNVLLWDVASRRSYRPDSEKLPGTYHNVYLSTAGKIISTSVDKTTLKVSEVENSELAELTKPEAGLLRAEAFTPSGYRLARVDRECNIHVWECTSSSNDMCKNENWKKHIILVGHTVPSNRTGFSRQHIEGVAFSPDGKRIASISRDSIAYLWDVDSGEQITELPLTPPPRRGTYREYDTGIAFSPQGDIVAGGKWGEIVLWDATEGKTLMTFPQPEGSQRPITLCFSPCGEYLASGAWWQPGLQKVPIRLWEVASGENIATFWSHTTDVQCFAFSQDGTLLVSGGHDGAIYLWDLTPYL
jgi:WD40 repeat protein